ncbi:DUF397 domain-containing protein [Sphaerisporangium sp. NPDC088356]|uniref:DUF397 domain-containing protein n=1 Tax=Sphaerisporangium sp. NPDC088356 TaxID=3154871 RepID=UPI003422ED5C
MRTEMDNVTQELAEARWRKSAHSGSDGSNCVEVAHLHGGRRAVRDSKDRNGPALVVTPEEWTTFLTHVKTDRPV